MKHAYPSSASVAPLAGLFCLFGFLLHILLSDPLLLAVGFHYSGDEGAFYEKIHPGSLFIFLSFPLLLLESGNPFHQSYLIARDHTAFAALLIVATLMFIYVVLRSGPEGSAFLLDTHLTVPICAMVLCYTPPRYCLLGFRCFIWLAILNAGIGIGEAVTHERIFTFDPDWKVLKEEYFRASALRGHPLNNAMFTCIALFLVPSLRIARIFRALLMALLLVALVAFGGRIALAYGVLGVGLYISYAFWRWLRARELSPVQWLQLLALVITIPLLGLAAIYGLIESGIGERIAAHGLWDKSAHSRMLAPLVFDYMRQDELWLGIPVPQIVAIVGRMNQLVPIDDIENPWLLMLMVLGIPMFVIWLGATIAFACRLMRGQSLATQLAVLAYYITASTSNSFGRKDSTYLIMVCAVMCVAQSRLYFAATAPKIASHA